MKASRIIKDNRFIRGFYGIWNRNFGNCNRRRFGFIAKTVVLSPPFFGHTKNIYIYDKVGIGPHAHLSTPNAKIVFKGNIAPYCLPSCYEAGSRPYYASWCKGY